jgi:predicted small secreted protein
VGSELLQHLLISYSLAKCNHNRGIGDTRNDVVNLGEALDEGAQRLPRALLDSVEVGLIAWPGISALKVGRELAAQL